MPRPRIWIVTPELHRRGGSERAIAEQIQRWRQRFDIRVYAMSADDGAFPGDIQIVRGPPGPHLVRFAWWFAANRFRRAVDERLSGRPDAVVSPGVNCLDADAIGVQMVFAKYWAKVRGHALALIRSHPASGRSWHRLLYSSLIRRLERHIYAGPALLWSLSEADGRELEAHFGRPSATVAVAPHGVDVEAFRRDLRLGIRSRARRELGLGDERVLLLVGNDLWAKGADLAIRALEALPDDVILALVGHLREAEVMATAGPHLTARIRVWPHRPDPLSYYAAADVLVAPSREDSFNLPVLEAMASGLPVVVSGRAGVSELVEHGRDALVIGDPEDVAEFAAAIARALESGVAAELTVHGRELAQRVTWNVNADRTAELIMREITTPRVIVLATDAFGTGGIERTTRTLIRTLGERFGADRVGVLSVWGGRADLPARILHRGRRAGGARPVPVAEQAMFAISAFRQAWRWRRRLVLVACHPHLAPVALAAGRIAGSRVAVWCHGDEVWRPLRPSVGWALRHADLVFAPSRFTGEQVTRWAGLERVVTVVPHGNPPELVPLKPAPVPGRVLSVARLDPGDRYKGVDTLVRAWPRVLESHPDAELIVVGEGADRSRLERLATDSGADGHVRFTGRIDDRDLEELYRTASVFALPTGARVGSGAGGEGFGLVFLEAAASGVPVVAGRSGAVPEVVEDGQTGLLVEPGDLVAVADAIGVLLKDENLRSRMSRAARARARNHFSYAAFGDRIESVLVHLASVFVPET